MKELYLKWPKSIWRRNLLDNARSMSDNNKVQFTKKRRRLVNNQKLNFVEDSTVEKCSEKMIIHAKSKGFTDDTILNGDEAIQMSEKVYTGIKNYKDYTPKKEISMKNVMVGPAIETNSNVRAVTFIDYQPDVCKDYKETGFCGFGDSCKFLHDREIYKAGWQLDLDWKMQQENAKNKTSLDEQEKSKLIEIPFACFICKKKYRNPIETLCKHYYCEQCAIERYKKIPTCLICGSDTKGLFNSSKKIKEMLSE